MKETDVKLLGYYKQTVCNDDCRVYELCRLETKENNNR